MAVSEAYKKWYAKSKVEHNAKRRARYKNDESYRTKVQVGIRTRRVKAKSTNPVKDTYYIKQASELVGVSPQKIRGWESKEYIPKSVNELGYRVYTMHHILLMTSLNEILDNQYLKEPEREEVIAKTISNLKGDWNGSQSQQENV